MVGTEPQDTKMEADALPQKHVVDAETSSNGDGAVVVAETARVLDHQAEMKLCRKFDVRILPVLAVMCTGLPLFLSFLLPCPGSQG